MIQKNNRGLVIVVNKWDLIEKDTFSTKVFENKIYEKIAPFKDVPIFFTSAISKQRVLKAVEEAMDVNDRRRQKISTSALNDLMLPLLKENPPPANKGKYIKIKYCTQLPTYSPKFAFFANLPQYVKEPYKRYVENQLRKNFDFSGVPIEIYFRKK